MLTIASTAFKCRRWRAGENIRKHEKMHYSWFTSTIPSGTRFAARFDISKNFHGRSIEVLTGIGLSKFEQMLQTSRELEKYFVVGRCKETHDNKSGFHVEKACMNDGACKCSS